MMRTLSLTFLATALCVLSYGSLATEGAGSQRTMTIAGSGCSILPVGDRSEKVVPDAIQTYPITSVSSKKNLHSTSIVYE